MSRYPFAFSIFYGFVIDVFYLKRFGKTLTYVIFLGYFFSIWMFFVSFVLESQLANLEVDKITFEIFVFMLILALYDLSAQTWMKSVIAPDYPKMIGKTSIAYNGAQLFGCGGFLFLSQKGYLSIRTFCFIIAMYALIQTLVIQFVYLGLEDDDPEASKAEKIAKKSEKS